MGSERRDKSLGANSLEFAWGTGCHPELFGVVGNQAVAFGAAAAGGRFVNADAQTLGRSSTSDHGGYVRLADTSVVTGYENSDGCTHVSIYATMIDSAC